MARQTVCGNFAQWNGILRSRHHADLVIIQDICDPKTLSMPPLRPQIFTQNGMQLRY